jgi:hypothetical protein
MSKARDLANGATALSAVSATELGYVDGVTSAIQTQLDAKIAKTLTTTTGDTIYASSANTPARLGVGTTGQVLTVAAGVPSWATPAGGGGKVLQVIQATTSTQVINSTMTYADTTLTASITPSATSSKVLVLVVQQNVARGADDQQGSVALRLLRGATSLGEFSTTQFYQNAAQWFIGNISINYLDSPATTSATTYKTQFISGFGTANDAYVQKGSTGISTIILLEIGA